MFVLCLLKLDVGLGEDVGVECDVSVDVERGLVLDGVGNWVGLVVVYFWFGGDGDVLVGGL